MQLLFRADGNSQIGLGHVVRSLALAETLLPHYQCLFAIQRPSVAITQQIRNNDCGVIPLPATTDYLTEAKEITQKFADAVSVIILDGYQYTTAYQEILRPYFKIICLDDLHAIHFVTDIIINPAGGITDNDYSKEAHTMLYTGPEYALLRTPFLKAAAQSRSFPDNSRVFLNMGGADPDDYTGKIIRQLVQRPEVFSIEAVVGSAYPHTTALENLVAQYSRVTIHRQLTAEQMCTLMQACSVAILPPSSVAYEWCSVGGPLFLIRTADNQKNLEQFLLENHLAYPLSDLNQLLPDILVNGALFSEQISRQRTYFDGQSAARLRQVFNQLLYSESLHLRRAQPEDLQLLFDWINEPAVRQFSLNPAPVPLAMHTTWFQFKLTDKNCFIFIAEIQTEPVGMIRFDINKGEAIISYLLDKNYRGKGLGFVLLQKGILMLRVATNQVSSISGLVQKQNIASVKAFEKAGFTATLLQDSQLPNILKFTLPA